MASVFPFGRSLHFGCEFDQSPDDLSARRKTGAKLLFEVFSQRYERGATIVTSNLPFDEWKIIFGSERLTGALLDLLPHHVHILELNRESYRLAQSKRRSRCS